MNLLKEFFNFFKRYSGSHVGDIDVSAFRVKPADAKKVRIGIARWREWGRIRFHMDFMCFG